MALDLGINFIDTAREYQGSEFLIGQVIRARMDKSFHVSTKTFNRSRDGAQRAVDKSLGVLGADKIDIYQLHDVSSPEAWQQVMRDDGALAGLKIARERGLIDHIGVSSHSVEILEMAITCGEFDAVMLEYSAFYHETAQLIKLAKQRDVGIMVMRPLGGSGRTSSIRSRMRESGGEILLSPKVLLLYVLSNPDISVATSGARYPSRVSENVELALTYQSLSETQKMECEKEAESLF